jgi:hypothetical protein
MTGHDRPEYAAASPRLRKRAHYPPNLHEPRPGYFTWRNPLDGKTHVIGRIPLAHAIQEANEANARAEGMRSSTSLADRFSYGQETIADLLAKMPTAGLKPNTLSMQPATTSSSATLSAASNAWR